MLIALLLVAGWLLVVACVIALFRDASRGDEPARGDWLEAEALGTPEPAGDATATLVSLHSELGRTMAR